MTKIYRCPRCGETFEHDFCPQCDLHFTKKGVFRPQEEQHNNNDSTPEHISEVEQTSQHFFNKRELKEGEFSKDIFNKTVGEVIAENHLTYNYHDVLPSLANLPQQQEDDELLNNKPSHPMVEEKDEKPAVKTVADDTSPKSDSEDESTQNESTPTHSSEEKQTDDILVEYLAEPHREEEEHHKMPALRLSKKGLWIALVCIILCGGVSYGVVHYQQQKEQAIVEKKESTIEHKINAFYVDHNPKEGFLKQTVTKEKIAPIEELITTLEAKNKKDATRMEKQLAQLEASSELQQKVNALFVSPRIEGKNIHQVAIKENVSIQLVEKKKPTTAFEKAVNESIRDAKQQQKTMNTAKKEVQALIDKGQVSAKATEKDYKAAQKNVSQIQNKTVKQTLTGQLKTVKQVLDERAAEKKALEEQKKAQEAAQKAEAKKQNTISSTQSQSTTAIDATEEKNAKSKVLVDPTNNTLTDFASTDPYTWEKGIKSKVLNTCIERGYISPDHYVLNKAYEYNGEGYYNLYSTRNGVNHYLVTINCKTGWFKGNG